MPNLTYRLTPQQRKVLDDALAPTEHATIAALITAALTEYLAAREITYPAPNAKGWPKKADTPAPIAHWQDWGSGVEAAHINGQQYLLQWYVDEWRIYPTYEDVAVARGETKESAKSAFEEWYRNEQG